LLEHFLQSAALGPVHSSQFAAHLAMKRKKSLTPKDSLLAASLRVVVMATSVVLPV